MTYYEFIFEGGDGSPVTAAGAIAWAYPNLAPVPETSLILAGGQFGVVLPADEVSDPDTLSGALAAAITNATGSYTQVDSYSLKSDTAGGSPGAPTGPLTGLNLGNFLNSIGESIRNLLAKLPSLSTLILILLAILLLFLGVGEFGKGLGEGAARRV